MQPSPYVTFYTYERLTGRNLGKAIGPSKSRVYGAEPDDDNDAIEPRQLPPAGTAPHEQTPI